MKQEQWCAGCESAERALDAAGATASLSTPTAKARAKAHYRRGICRARLGNLDGAESDLRRALRGTRSKAAKMDVRRELEAVEAEQARRESSAREHAGLEHLRRTIEDMPDDEVSMEGCMQELARVAKRLPDSKLAHMLRSGNEGDT